MSAMRTCSGLIGPSPSEAANASALPAIELYAGGNSRPLDSAGHRQRARRDLCRQTLSADPRGLEHIPSRRALRELGNGEEEEVVTRDGITHASCML